MSVLDTQGPLNRRKALVARLMAQLGQAGTSSRFGGGGVGITHGHVNPAGRFPSVAPVTPLLPVNRELPAPAAPQTAPPAPGAEPQPQESPAPAPSAPWQNEGYVSEQAYNEFMGLDEGSQARILANPVARRRFFV